MKTKKVEKTYPFSGLPEDVKQDKVFTYALMHCQGFLHNPRNLEIPQIQEYVEYLKEVVDYIAEKQGMTGVRLY